jgi:hypothetical protein
MRWGLGLLATLAMAVSPTLARADFAASAGGATVINRYTSNGVLTGFDTTTAPVQALAYSRTGNLLVLTGASGGTGTISNVLGPAVNVGTLGANPGLAAGPLGGFFFTAGGSNQVNQYNDQGNLIGFTTFVSPVQALAVGQAGSPLALIGAIGGAGTLTGLSGGPVSVGTLGSSASLAADLQSGRVAVSLGGSNRVDIYNPNGSLSSFLTFVAPVQALAYDPFGDLLVLFGNVGGPGSVTGFPGGGSVALGTLGAHASLASTQAVPEPSSLVLFALGLGLLVAAGGKARMRYAA